MNMLLALAFVLQQDKLQEAATLVEADWCMVTTSRQNVIGGQKWLSLRPGETWTSGVAWYIGVDSERGGSYIASRGKYTFYGNKLEEGTLMIKIAFTRLYEGAVDEAGKCRWTIDKSYEGRPTGVTLEVPLDDGKVAVNPLTVVVAQAFWIDDDGDERSTPKDASLKKMLFGGKQGVYRTGHMEVGATLELRSEYDETFMRQPPPGFKFRDSAKKRGEQAEKAQALSVALRLGAAEYKNGRFAQAIELFDKALTIDPDKTETYLLRGSASHRLKHYDKAIGDFTRVIGMTPTSADAHRMRAASFHCQEDYSRAIADYTTAIRLSAEPRDFCYRALSSSKLKKYTSASSDYAEAIRRDPDDLSSLNGLAWLLATCPQDDVRDGAKALECAKKACELTGWKDPFYMDTLAAAHAEAGGFEKAVEWQRKAVEGIEEKFKQEAQLRLTLFEQHKPFREQ